MGRVEAWLWEYRTVFVVLTLTYLLFAYQEQQMGTALDYLQRESSSLTQRRERLLAEQKRLKEELASVDDPAWRELVLREELGVVPTGWRKISLK